MSSLKDELRQKGVKGLFAGDTDNTLIQFFRYIFVGGFAFVVDAGVMTLLAELAHFDKVVAGTVGFVLGLAVNYFLSTFWIFKNSAVSNRLAEFGVFAAIGLAGLLINAGILWLFDHVLGPNLVFGGLLAADKYYLIGKLFSTAGVFVWNFAARKVILYRGK